MNILVTGATGFIGRALTQSLAARGDQVIAVARSQPRDADSSIVRVDLADAEAVHAFAAGIGAVDVTVHLATRIPQGVAADDDGAALTQANVVGLKNLLDAFGRHLGHFLYASTIDVYGNSSNAPYQETQPLAPVTAYGQSKAAGEEIVRQWAGRHGGAAAILRLSQVYGPGEPPVKVIPRLIESIRLGQPLTIGGGGRDKRRFLARADAVRAIERAIDAQAMGVFNIAGDEVVSIREVVAILESLLGRTLPIRAAPGNPTGDRYMAIDHARTSLGFAPAISLAQGLREYLVAVGLLASERRQPAER
jgi:UDP-glucose 4-epimerase